MFDEDQEVRGPGWGTLDRSSVLKALERIHAAYGRRPDTVLPGQVQEWHRMLDTCQVPFRRLMRAVDLLLAAEARSPSLNVLLGYVAKAAVEEREGSERSQRAAKIDEWERIEAEDRQNPRFRTPQGWSDDVPELPAWIRKMAWEHGLCSESCARDARRAMRAVPVLKLYAANHGEKTI